MKEVLQQLSPLWGLHVLMAVDLSLIWSVYNSRPETMPSTDGIPGGMGQCLISVDVDRHGVFCLAGILSIISGYIPRYSRANVAEYSQFSW